MGYRKVTAMETRSHCIVDRQCNVAEGAPGLPPPLKPMDVKGALAEKNTIAHAEVKKT